MLRHVGFSAWGAAACCAIALGIEATARAQFTPGNVVVSVSGTNPTAGAPSIAPLSLVEYTRGGVPTGYVLGLPSADTPVATGTNYAIAGTTQSTALYGALKRSVDGRFLTITGANVPVATGTDALTFGVFSTASFPNRVIARVDVAGSVDTTTRFAARGAMPNGAITTDGTSMWWASDTGSLNSGGVRYLTLGSTVAGPQLTGIDLSPDSRANTNGIGIFDGQLYIAYSVNPFRGVYALGTGLQQSGGPLVATTVVSSTSATDFFFANANTLYVAVSNTNPLLQGLGLQKWVRSDGGPWTNVWAANPAEALGIRGIAGGVSGGTVEIFGVTLTSTSSATPNSLLRVADTLAGTSFPGFETLATSAPNSLFRGVAFTPVPEPAAWTLGLAGLGLLFGRSIARRRPAAKRHARCLVHCGVLGWAVVCGAAAHAQFTPGRIVVSQYGDGVTTSGTVPITLREFTTTGSPGFVVALPATNALPNYAIVGPLSATDIGILKQSVDRRYVSIISYGTNATASRVIARVDASGSIDTTTQFSAAGSTPGSAITTDGTDFWWSGSTGSGNTGGIRYLQLGSSVNGVALAQGLGGSSQNAAGDWPVPYNERVLGIFGNQLYGTSAVAVGPAGSTYSFRGVFNAGTGLQTSGTLFGKIIVGGGANDAGVIDSPREFFIADSNTIYVADDDSTGSFITGGVQKWLKSTVTGSWSKVWTAKPDGSTGMRGLTGLVTGSSVQLYGITAVATSTGANSLVALTDTLDGMIAPSFDTLATSGSNFVFRGVAFAPVPEPAAVALSIAGLAVVMISAALRRGRRG